MSQPRIGVPSPLQKSLVSNRKSANFSPPPSPRATNEIIEQFIIQEDVRNDRQGPINQPPQNNSSEASPREIELMQGEST